jgi:transposase InsO family protein
VGISKSGFYECIHRMPSQREMEDRKLADVIRVSFVESRKVYGCRRIRDDLKDLGHACSKSKVHRLMTKEGLRSVHTKKFRVVTTDSKHNLPVAPNTLHREFEANMPNEKWAGDITYVPTDEGWLFVAAELDLFSRKVIGLSMEDHMKTELCSKALTSALVFRNPQRPVLHHSDRGSQYASEEYQRLLEQFNCIASMSRKGNCWDNAVVESFFKTLKVECIYQHHFKTRQQAKEVIFDYIFNFYNCKRKHSALDYQSPIEYEKCAA